jgi:hypothetical protein
MEITLMRIEVFADAASFGWSPARRQLECLPACSALIDQFQPGE